MIILVELLRQVIGVVRDDGGAEGRAGFGDLPGEGAQQLDQPDLLRGGDEVGGDVGGAEFHRRLPQDRADAGVRVLDEGAGVAV